MSLIQKLRSFVDDRRKRQEPVQVDRRAKMKRREVDERLHCAMSELERTVRISREELFKREVANDTQQTVIFSTYREICTMKVSAGEHRLCRHPQHEAANTGIARCDEELCPVMRGNAA